MIRCDHCLIEIKDSDYIKEDFEGRELRFCCRGCQGVYHILHDAGLEEFYVKRQNWQPGPPESVEIDPGVFEDLVRDSDGFKELDLLLSGIRCASCIWLIEHYIRKRCKVEEIRVNYATHRARIKWDPRKCTLEEIIEEIRAIGYTPRPAIQSEAEEMIRREGKDLLVRFGTAAFFSMQLMLYTAALYAGYFQGIEAVYRTTFQYIAWAVATPVMFYSGAPFIRNTIRGIKNRTLNMDVLIFLGSFSAYLYSVVQIFLGGEVYFDTAAMIITLILLGRFLEVSARGRAGEAISALLGLQPKEARLIRGEQPVMIPISALKIGDVIESRAGERIPIDGVIVEGSAEVDESMLSGESKPVSKTPGDEVFAGTYNLNGRLLTRVTRTGNETVLSQIIQAVEEAQSRKAPVQAMADRVVGWFVPFVLGISLMSFIYWFWKDTPTVAMMNSVAVLVVACPCALGLATPLAVLIGSTMASRRGIVVKGADIIESLARTDYIVFDKTGTLTEGKHRLTDIREFGDNDTILRYAASVEALSGHTLAEPIAKAYNGKRLHVEQFQELPGMGIKAEIEGKKVLLGNTRLLESERVSIAGYVYQEYEKFVSQGKTTILVSIDNEVTGLLALIDDIRNDAIETVRRLKERGYHLMMLTGDNSNVAAYISERAGIKEFIAEAPPLRKAEIIRELRKQEHIVSMVGDGINDAPPLTEADVGIAVGRATDIALESADVVIIKDDLTELVSVLDLSRATLSTIKQNLLWAFSYNIIAIPLAVSGLLHPIVSAAFMAVSSLIVVGNSLRLFKREV